jgi:hypothetical protein
MVLCCSPTKDSVKATFLINDGFEFNLQLGKGSIPTILQVKILPLIDYLIRILFLTIYFVMVLIYLYKMEFHSATKKNEILSFAGKWVELKNIILREISQTQKAKSCMFSFICGIQMQQCYETLVTLRGGHTQER